MKLLSGLSISLLAYSFTGLFPTQVQASHITVATGIGTAHFLAKQLARIAPNLPDPNKLPGLIEREITKHLKGIATQLTIATNAKSDTCLSYQNYLMGLYVPSQQSADAALISVACDATPAFRQTVEDGLTNILNTYTPLQARLDQDCPTYAVNFATAFTTLTTSIAEVQTAYLGLTCV